MKKKWVMIPIETKAREFESRSLLTYHLVKKGYGVVSVPWVFNYEKQLPKGLWFVNNLFKANYNKIKRIKETGSKLYALDEEGLLYINEDRYLMRIYDRNFEATDKFLCYGEVQKNLISEKYPYMQDKVVEVGNPRINLLNSMFDVIDKKDVEGIRRDYPNMILIVSNFSNVNIFGSETAKRSDRYKATRKKAEALKLLETQEQIDEFEREFKHLDIVLSYFTKLVKRLGEEFPESQIVIRPHPSENHEFWRKLAGNRNIYVVYQGNLTSWIKAATIVIQQNCTSSIESLFLGKPCISYRPLKGNAKYDQPLTRLLSLNFDKEDDVIDVVRRVGAGDLKLFNDSYPRFIKESKQYISNQERDLSVGRIIDEIKREEIDNIEFNKLMYNFSIINIRKKMLKVRSTCKITLGEGIYKTLGSLRLKGTSAYSRIGKRLDEIKEKKYWKCYATQKRGNITEEDFLNIFSKFNSIYNDSREIKVEKLEDQVFMVYEKQ